MAKVDLSSVYKVTAKGRTYYYAWRGKGAPRLVCEPGSPAFIAELHEALTSRKQVDKDVLSALCGAYRNSEEFTHLASSTKKQWQVWLTRIEDHFGALSLKQFDRPIIRVHIRKWRDKWKKNPRTADYGLQVLSRLLSMAVADGHIQNNPCMGIPRLYKASRGDLIWTESDLTALSLIASPELMFAARLASLTGIRRGDLLQLSWSCIKEHSIEFQTGKSAKRTTVVIPIFAELRSLLDHIPRRGPIVLTNQNGRPWRSGFSSSWNKAVRKSGIDLHFHDLRGTAATRFYGSLTNREIATVMGWSEARVERLIDRYVKKDELIRDRIRRLDGTLGERRVQNSLQNGTS